MTIEQRIVGTVVILDLRGTLGVTMNERLYDKVHSLIFEGHRALVVNMADITHIDSTGLAVLVRAYSAVRHAGGRIVLLNVTGRVSTVLAITKLVTVFDVADSEAEALASVAESAPASA
jgi:anti-sigma B factor antagonist